MSINKSVSLPVVTSILTVTNEKNEKQVLKVFDDKYKENIIHTENLDEVVDVHRISALDYGSKVTGIQFKGKYHVNLTNEDVARSLSYLYKKGSEEVKRFNKTDFVKRIAIEKD